MHKTTFLSRNPRSVILIASLLLAIAPADAGPPFQTDDPQPVGFRHWEAYFASQITQSADGINGAAPQIEINFGPLPSVQLHLIVPMAFNADTANNAFFGQGDIEFGVKYRFIDEQAFIPQVGTFPHLEYPAGKASHGLGNGHLRIFVPLWAQKSWGPWTTYGGGGYWINGDSAANNSWFFGGELQRDLSAMVTTGAELFVNTPGSIAPEMEVGFTIGAIVNLTASHHILGSLGRDIRGGNTISAYAAYQFTYLGGTSD